MTSQGLQHPSCVEIPQDHLGPRKPAHGQGLAVGRECNRLRITNRNLQATIRPIRIQVAEDDARLDPAPSQGVAIRRVSDGPGVVAVVEESPDTPATRRIPEGDPSIRVGRGQRPSIRGEGQREGRGLEATSGQFHRRVLSIRLRDRHERDDDHDRDGQIDQPSVGQRDSRATRLASIPAFAFEPGTPTVADLIMPHR